jgi:hypothetical protein
MTFAVRIGILRDASHFGGLWPIDGTDEIFGRIALPKTFVGYGETGTIGTHLPSTDIVTLKLLMWTMALVKYQTHRPLRVRLVRTAAGWAAARLSQPFTFGGLISRRGPAWWT